MLVEVAPNVVLVLGAVDESDVGAGKAVAWEDLVREAVLFIVRL